MNVSTKLPFWARLTLMLGASVLGLSGIAGAQPPRQRPSTPERVGGQVPSRVDPQIVSRARDACDAAAQRAGYRVMRRDRENVNGRSYNLPLHVAYGSNEGDVTCSYDPDRGLANIPPRDARRGFGGRERGSYDNQAQTLCENYVNQRRGYRVVSVGTPVQHGRNLWDVPMTVQRNGRQTTTTCRYNAASNKLSLR